MTRDFEKIFGFRKTLTLDKTFRFNQTLCDITNEFILRNKYQLRKKVKSNIQKNNQRIVEFHDLKIDEPSLDFKNNENNPIEFPQSISMYDGKDRKFEPITSSILNWNYNIVENPNFSWSEDCSPLPVTVQPGVIDKIELCFEIAKNSDHFKFTGYSYGKTQVLALFDRSAIGNTASAAAPEQQTQQTQQQTQQSKGGGCLIATAAFGSEMAPQIQFLRELRDNTVLQTESGT